MTDEDDKKLRSGDCQELCHLEYVAMYYTER
jgi:hypothetical protein